MEQIKGKETVDTYDFVIQGRENFAKVKAEYKTIKEYEKYIRQSNPCIKDKDIVRVFALIDGYELFITEF